MPVPICDEKTGFVSRGFKRHVRYPFMNQGDEFHAARLHRLCCRLFCARAEGVALMAQAIEWYLPKQSRKTS